MHGEGGAFHLAGELRACRTMPRVGRLQWAADSLGDVFHRQAFDLIKHKHLTLGLVEAGHRAFEQIELLALRETSLRAMVVDLVTSRFARDLAPNMRPPPMCGRCFNADATKPCTKGGAFFITVEFAKHHNEDFLANIVEVGVAYTEITKRTPHIGVMFAHQLTHLSTAVANWGGGG